MIGIIGALDEEVNGLVANLHNTKNIVIGQTSFYVGSHEGRELVVALSGVGKVNASLTAALMLANFPKICAIINIGVAGGIGRSVRRGDIVVSTACVQHDFTLNSDSFSVGRIVGFDFVEFTCNKYLIEQAKNVLQSLTLPFHFGIVASGDQFINSSSKAEWLRSTFGAIACDMESAAIAHVCYKMNIPFLSLRSMSDNGDDNAATDFDQWLIEAAANSIRCIMALTRSLDQSKLQ